MTKSYFDGEYQKRCKFMQRVHRKFKLKYDDVYVAATSVRKDGCEITEEFIEELNEWLVSTNNLIRAKICPMYNRVQWRIVCDENIEIYK